MPAPSLGEFERIDRFLKPLASGFSGALGLDDDAAVISPPAGMDLVVTADAIVEGIHFLPDDPPDTIGRKLLRVNVSDLVAKAADPYAYVLTMALPRDLDDDWLEAFALGLAEDQGLYGLHLIGGDSVGTRGPITLSVTAFGLVPKDRMVRRRLEVGTAAVYVTGSIGDALLGLDILTGQRSAPDEDDRAFLVRRYRLPQPRLKMVGAIRHHVSAAIDVSDGLAADLQHLARVSGLAATLDLAALPLSPAARRAVEEDGVPLERLATAGDDYEVLMAVSEGNAESLEGAARDNGVALTRVGAIRPGEPGTLTVRNAEGEAVALQRTGWRHDAGR